MEKATILVVDDEEDILKLVELNLAHEGYQVLTCTTGEKALEIARSVLPHLIILDLMLPGVDGLEVCRRLKSNPKTTHIPIVMLTAKTEDADIVAGLELGAADYVTKPFSGKVLVARVRRLLRAAPEPVDEQEVIKLRDLTIDPARHEVWAGNEKINLTRTEFDILRTLAKRPGLVLSRYQIVNAIHGADYLVTDRAVDVQIVSLRKKLGSRAAYIETVHGVGYRFRD
jgi:two-component system alkaline phosphatase synthesis response regulator PhoP